MDRQPLSLRENQQVTADVMEKIHEICQQLKLQYFLAYGTLIGAIRHKGYIPWDDDLDIMMPRKDYETLLDYFCTHRQELEPYRLFTPDTVADYPYMLARICDCRYEIDTDNEKNCGMGAFIDIYPMDGLGKTKEEAVARMEKAAKYVSMFFLSTRLRCEKGLTKSKLKLLIKFPAFVLAKLIGKKFFMKKLNAMAAKCDYDNSDFIGCLIWDTETESAVFPKEWFADTVAVPFESKEFLVPTAYDAVLKKGYGDYMKLPPEEDRIAHHFYRIYKK